MKKILITGKNSYVGTSLERWLETFGDRYSTESISLRDDSWRNQDFSRYDVVIHVAGLAHIKETKENAHIYFKVNRDLAYEVALEAKEHQVKQFIFLSSMSVYGIDTGVIGEDTILKPKSNYGKSKLEAEKLIANLEDDLFKVAILRPPMIYGNGCRGNYNRLSRIALLSPVFPDIDNERSMIYIDNLSEYIKYIIDYCEQGLFFPQNKSYVTTSEMVRLIAKTHDKKIFISRLFNPLISLLNRVEIVNKVFGNLVYEKSLSNLNEVNQISFEKTIERSEN